ncbi:MAG: acetylxylan esterase, partial [Candidatus Hydrogenedentes bacterium]|nr:acetylxylan esterase [Candidatus Hydrogenedentota bacterium]
MGSIRSAGMCAPVALMATPCAADEDSAELEPLNRFPRMMQEYLTARLRAVYEENTRRVMALDSKRDARRYVSALQGRMRRIFGPMPERTDLNLRVTGELERDGYVVRKLIFDSRPEFPVTANLYIPRGFEGSRPAVLALCGHSMDAKAYEPYQAFVQALARMGYITLVFDPIGQGERIQYHDGKGGSEVGGPVIEHNFIGRQQVLVGEFIGTWFVWDGIRAMDVLLAQENVDRARVGVTGNSGGGNMTVYAVATDPRITMAAPSCWVTSWHHNGVNEEPIDAEQCALNALGLGIEQSDLLLARAPMPILLVTQEQDFFDQRGSHEAFERMKHVYRLLGAEESVAYHVGPGVHGFSQDGREAMYAFFNRQAQVDRPGTEPELAYEAVADLRCTETGQVDELGARSIFEFTREKSRALAGRRGTPSGE